jgi:cell division protease FtsH
MKNNWYTKIADFLKISQMYKFIHRQYKIDKFRFWLIASLLSLMAIMSLLSIHTYFVQKNEYKLFIERSKELTMREFLDTLKNEEVNEVQVNNYRTDFNPLYSTIAKNHFVVELKNGNFFHYNDHFYGDKNKEYEQIVFDKNIKVKKLVIDHATKETILGSLFNMVFFIMFMIIIILIAQRAFADIVVGKNFNLTRNNDKIKFDDIIGYPEVKREFTETVHKLKNYESMKKKGIATPKGILLTGPPGVGKTMFAKALANECNAGFLYATGADFVELYVGAGARRVRSLFANARYMAPCIIFIDEIDALGTRDGYGMDSERLSTINQILAEMDGINENKAVLVVAATNHRDKVDAALLRPGRFDKKIDIPNPDLKTRLEILSFYNQLINKDLKHTKIKNELTDDDNSQQLPHLDLNKFAKITAGMSGADLKNLIDEAKNIFIRNNPTCTSINLSEDNLQEAFDTILLGVNVSETNPKELERVAYHELGHAIVGYKLGTNTTIEKITISGRGHAMGYTMQTSKEELKLSTKNELLSQITVFLAGRAAEEVILSEVSSGCADDLQKANIIAQKMVKEWGMGEITGMFSQVPNNNLDVSQINLNQSSIEQDINDILNTCYSNAKTIVSKHIDWIKEKKVLLIEKNSLDHKELFFNEL